MPSPLASEIAALFHRDLTRLLQELEAFPDEKDLWKTLPGVSNSAGNLALHLEGNLREFIGRQIGGVAYTRQRDAEFSTKNVSSVSLRERIASTRDLLAGIVPELSEAQLDAVYPQQMFGFPMTTRLFLVHLLSHLSWHLGQIDYLRRILTEGSALALAAVAVPAER